MKVSSFLLASLLPAAALAQNATILTGLVEALQAKNVTQIVTVAAQLNSTEVGQQLLANLTNGEPHILFAPSDEALRNAPSNITQDSGRLTDVFAYHIVPGNFSSSDIPHYPNTTIGRSLLTDPQLVRLEGGNKAQAVVWALRADGRAHVLNQRNDSTVVDLTTVGNLTIWIVDHLLVIPEDFNVTIHTGNQSYTAIQSVLESVQTPIFEPTTNQTTNVSLSDAINEQWHGFTFFVPNNDAVEAAQSTLQQLSGNQTALQNVLYNHIINGTTVYSPILAGENFTSAAGEDLTFHINSTGQFVTSGNVTAQIVQPDVLLPNGVIHVIDRVLANTESNSEAASSAVASATSAATASATESGPIGASITSGLNPSPTGANGDNNNNNNNSGALTIVPSKSTLVSWGVSVLAIAIGAVVIA